MKNVGGKNLMKEKRYLKTWQYFTFTGGNVGMAMPTNFISSFIIFFYSSFYLGLDVGIIGTLMLVAKLFDGVSDIIFGNIMDKCSSPMGKAYKSLRASCGTLL